MTRLEVCAKINEIGIVPCARIQPSITWMLSPRIPALCPPHYASNERAHFNLHLQYVSANLEN